MNSLWEAPRNAEFLEKIVDEISSGKIVLTFLPNHAPDDFLLQLRIKFGKNKSIIYDRINIEECIEENERPIESFLFSYFEVEEVEEETGTFIQKSAASIFNNIDFDPEKVFVFENLPSSLTIQFRDFILNLAHYLIGKPLYERHKVLVLLNPDNFKLSDFTSESGIQRILYQGFSDKLDHMLALRYYYRYESKFFTPLYERMITSLSVFDPRLTESLVDCVNLSEDYRELLNEYAKNKKWDTINYKEIKELTDEEIWERWSIGILEKVNSEYTYHSAFLGIHKKETELNKRVWQSGIEILMPLIEEIRNRILHSDKFYYPDVFPNKKTGEPITNKMNLEIGEIYYLINISRIHIRWLSSIEKGRMKNYIKLCREMRNDLSHLRIPSAQNIRKFFQEYDEIQRLLRQNTSLPAAYQQ